VGDISDRRARKKAQTRDQIRTVAHRLFAEHGFTGVTIADVARGADVAVQTVFNHFATKEELFFDGRTPWVEGPAASVRTREPSVAPLVALRAYLVETVRGLVASHTVTARRRYLETLEASESLRVHERELVHAAELRLRDALCEAWAEQTDIPGTPADPQTAAALVAAVWLAAARTMVLEQRPVLSDGACPDKTAVDVMELADRVLSQLEAGVALVHGRAARTPAADTGWPEHTIRRAG
jgi:AcrR family transcriptional regulator